jgi:hypothetical protein
MILAIASMGTERIAPGIPHIQNQKTSEMMTRTGFRVNRLARSIGVNLALDHMKSKVKRRRKQRLPKRVEGQQAGEKKDTSFPFIFSGMKVAETLAIIGIVVGEFNRLAAGSRL